MRTIEQILTLWSASLMTSDQVKEWAQMQIEKMDAPPMELFDLLNDGPEKCLKQSAEDFSPRPRRLSFNEEFCIRACNFSLNSDEETLAFALWTSRRCMGEDLENPLVSLSYLVDHLLEDCGDEAVALAQIRKALPPLLAQCASVAAPFLSDVD